MLTDSDIESLFDNSLEDYTPIEVKQIVFIQLPEDIEIMESELIEDDSESAVIDYMLQWDYGDSNEVLTFYVKDINTEFLGYLRNIDNRVFLYSYNSRIGYYGLSEITNIIKEG